MAIGFISKSGHTTYNLTELVLDTDDDIDNLPVDLPINRPRIFTPKK